MKKEAAERAAREAAQVDHAKENYGKLPMIQSTETVKVPRIQLDTLTEADLEKDVVFRARVQTSRAQGNKMAFLLLRQQTNTIQALASVNDDGSVSKQMVKFTAGINKESIVLVHGKVVKPFEEVKSATISNLEIHVTKIFIISQAQEVLPMVYEDASRNENDPAVLSGELPSASLNTRLDNRSIDFRTLANQSIFRIQSGICQLFREYLTERGFIEFHTPKLISAASEGGSNVFEVTYFNKKAYLAQSPQLYKQMLIAGDFEKVFEIGPVFRAENSNTHRHMTEVRINSWMINGHCADYKF